MRPHVAAAKALAKGIDTMSSTVATLRKSRMRARRFAHLVEHNAALVRPVRAGYLADIDRYWQTHFGRKVDPKWHVLIHNAIGREDVRFVPHNVWWDDAIPFLNDTSLFPAFSDKNLYSRLLRGVDAPRTHVKRIRGHYYDGDDRPVPREQVLDRIVDDGLDKIVKPSRTDNGEGVRRLQVTGRTAHLAGGPLTLDELEREYGQDFLVQSVIVQHPAMAQIHPHSVNTVRLMTLRWQDRVLVPIAWSRSGRDGRVNDNAGTGGIACGIDDDGRLLDAGIDEFGRSYPTHPTSGFDYAQRMAVPGFDRMREHVCALHAQLPQFDLLSWDIAVSPSATPVFLEVNFRGSSWIYQMACRRPIFGDLTPDVLEAIAWHRDRR